MLFFVFSVALAGFFMFQWKRDEDILSKNIVVMNKGGKTKCVNTIVGST